MPNELKQKNATYTYWPCSICIGYAFVAVTNISNNFNLSEQRFIWLTVLVHHGREDLEACIAQPWHEGRDDCILQEADQN